MAVGNKAALLGEFARNTQMRIPRGFVVPAYVFDATLVANDIYIAVFQRIYKTDFNDRRDIALAARFAMRKVQSMHIPKFILLEIIRAAQNLNGDMFAVRSSAVVEDKIKLSWAGQFETILGASVSTLERDIKKVWASMFSYNALSYRAIHKRIYDSYGMAVIVQELIPAQISGVGFSVHPNSDFEDVHTVEAVSGIGKLLVSGKESPDVYFIEKKWHTLIDASIKIQKKESVFVARKLISRKMSRSRGARMLLSREDAKTISRNMSFLEKQFGVPVTIEWSKYKNQINLLQVRPISQKRKVGLYTHKIVWHKQVQAFLVTEIWAASERYTKKLLGINAVADPIFVHKLNSGVDVYYHKDDIRNKPIVLLDFYRDNPELFIKALQHYMKLVDEMKSVAFLERSSFEIFDVLERAWPFMGVLYVLLDLRARGVVLPKWLEKEVVRARIVGEKISHNIFSHILSERETAVGGPAGEFYYTDFLTKKEIITGVFVAANTLRRRSKKIFVYYQDEIYIGTRAQKLMKEKIFAGLKSFHYDGELYGKRIYSGKISGSVYVYNVYTDMHNIPNGYILVARSLSPECVSFLPKGIAGILIEEGGEFSHGAILARERKIPCIVGIKDITKILKTGDEISVSAKGEVLELKK